MSPERRQQIEKLFHEALTLEPAARVAFLAEACGTDASLRQAIESLLAHHEQSESFIESPADVAAHPDRMQRFVQEANAASALNHPNIITIYEIELGKFHHYRPLRFLL